MNMFLAHRLHIVVIVTVILSVLSLLSFVWLKPAVIQPIIPLAQTYIAHPDPHISNGVADSLKKQRDEVSKMMNSVKRELAIMSCEMIELKGKLKMSVPMVSASGGWCRKTSFNNSGHHAFDKSLAEALSILFKAKTVASFGDGPGDYKRYLDSTQRLKLYDAYDGAPYGPETSGGAVKFLDLTAPQYGLQVYDWVISLEVAEHIPAKYESVYIDNIVRHAGRGIVLSWAVPGQGGLAHINNKPLDYVKKILSEKGFETDMKESIKLQKAARYSWLKKNVYVYLRREGSSASGIYA